uniref:DUF148 domain-containing protein n=1 Tax=Caenorhabditis tropicalis TaxID=1561998 RepID=A0A1I7SZY7_9PELO
MGNDHSTVANIDGRARRSLDSGMVNKNILTPLLTQVFDLVRQLLQAIEQILASLGTVFDDLTAILNQNGTIEEQTQAITELRNRSPVEVDTIFYIASQLGKTLSGGNGGIVPSVPLPTPQTPQVPV